MSMTTQRARITAVDAHRGLYCCDHCRQVWSPKLRSGGRLPRGWWRCPNGCNAEVLAH